MFDTRLERWWKGLDHRCLFVLLMLLEDDDGMKIKSVRGVLIDDESRRTRTMKAL